MSVSFAARRRRLRSPPGSSPGTLVAHPEARRPTVRLMAFGPEELHEVTFAEGVDLAAIGAEIGKWPVVWVDVEGLADAQLVQALGEMFGLHALALEDALDLHQRPKVEPYGDHLFIVTRVIDQTPAPATEQVAMFLGQRYVLTFQDRPGESFAPVRARVRKGRGRLRAAGADYLAYALLDFAIDGFFPVLENIGERLETLERTVAQAGAALQMREVQKVKRDLASLRRAVWPQREMLHQLARDCAALFAEPTRPFLRDAHDHVMQLADLIETDREIASSLVDLQMMAVNLRMNEIMQVLTVIATIFMPLGFIASLYGMNFDRTASPWNMPELGWRYGYPFALLLMLAVAVGLIAYFGVQGFLRRGRAKDTD